MIPEDEFLPKGPETERGVVEEATLCPDHVYVPRDSVDGDGNLRRDIVDGWPPHMAGIARQWLDLCAEAEAGDVIVLLEDPSGSDD